MIWYEVGIVALTQSSLGQLRVYMASMLKVSLVWWEEPSGSDVNCDGI